MLRDGHERQAPLAVSSADCRRLMRICSQASVAELSAALARLAPLPPIEVVRQPEVGLIMLRGYMGGDGAPFNALGFSYLLGCCIERARLAAIVDVLGQSSRYRDRLEIVLLAPVMRRVHAERSVRRAETAATRVQFLHPRARGGLRRCAPNSLILQAGFRDAVHDSQAVFKNSDARHVGSGTSGQPADQPRSSVAAGARSAVLRPILPLDEPTAALDDMNRATVKELIEARKSRQFSAFSTTRTSASA
jgi:alpha-D-ribose 1-methylphosphonate 5-triphosphate synthase subunit PhnG